jgi:hypothetical protein
MAELHRVPMRSLLTCKEYARAACEKGWNQKLKFVSILFPSSEEKITLNAGPVAETSHREFWSHRLNGEEA